MEKELLEECLARGHVARSDRQARRQARIDGQLLAEEARAGCGAGGEARAKGAPSKEETGTASRLAETVARSRDGRSAWDRSLATIRYWMRKYELRRSARSASETRAAPERAREASSSKVPRAWDDGVRTRGPKAVSAASDAVRRLSQDGAEVTEENPGGGGWRASACSAGIDRCILRRCSSIISIPATKEFQLARGGLPDRSARVRAEASKCVLLCANCHAEVEAGD